MTKPEAQGHTPALPRLVLERADSFANACIFPDVGDGYSFKLVGAGTIKKQNEIGKGIIDAVNSHASLKQRVEELEAAAADALAGWQYIRKSHGDLYGVGWDRVEEALKKALSPRGET